MGSLITVKNGRQVHAGDVLARIPQETSKTRDITDEVQEWPAWTDSRSQAEASPKKWNV